MKNKVMITVVSCLLMSAQGGFGMDQLPQEVIWNLFSRVVLQIPGAKAVSRYVGFSCVCRYWHNIVMSKIDSQIGLCSQDEKNRFLFNTINTCTSDQMRDLLLRGGAAIHGSVKILKNILVYDCPSGAIECTAPSCYEVSPWFHAVAKADIDALSFFIKNGASIDTQEDSTGLTALMKACDMGNTNLVEFLLQKGARSDLYSCVLKTAYEYACTKEVKLLLDRYQAKQV